MTHWQTGFPFSFPIEMLLGSPQQPPRPESRQRCCLECQREIIKNQTLRHRLLGKRRRVSAEMTG